MMTLPTFNRNIEFSEQSPREGKRLYRYVTQRSIIVEWKDVVPKGTKVSCRDEKKREWLYFDDKHFIIMRSYAWDGCTPKRHIPIFGWVGTPDFDENIMASLVHDAFLQFHESPDFPLKRKDIDRLFLEIMEHHQFKYRRIYYKGVSFYAKFDK